MREFSKIGEELFNKLRGRFPSVTIGDAEGNVTNEPIAARYFDFDYKGLGKVSVNLDEDEGLTVIFSKDFAEGTSDVIKKGWHDFLKELRVFGKKRMLDFSVRDITKSNLDKRDYKFLATNRSGDDKMTESKLYGTSRVSYQNVGEARIMIKHTESVNQESATGRTQKIGKIYIESPEGERFKYPYKHLSGARAMARHVAEGGNAYDDFGKHIVGLSEEMAKLRKFKTYMGRSAVMAESLAGYVDIVKERITTVKKTIENLQKPAYYKETFEAFNPPVLEDVPSDVAENWIDQLTIRQFNEELKDVFPYIYKLVSEASKAVELGPEDLLGENSSNTEDLKHMKDLVKGIAKNPFKGDKVAKKINKKYGKDLAGKDIPTNEAQMDANALKAWYNKYDDEQSWDAYSLGNGFFKWKLDSGIATDAMERSEVEALIKKFGEEEVMDDPFAAMEKAPELAPITTAMHNEFSKIVGKRYPDEEDFEKASNLIQDIDEGESHVDESGLQYYTGVKKHGKEYMKKAAQAGREGASQEELGRLKDKYSKAEKKTKEEFELEQAFEDAMGQFADSVCEECGNPSWRTLDEEKQKGVDGKVCWKGYKRMGTKMKGGKRVDNCVKVKEDDLEEGQYDGKSREELLKMKADAEASIKNMKSSGDDPQSRFYDETQMMMAQQHLDSINNALKKAGQEEGNAYANAVRQAKKDGKKKGDKIQGPDGDEITLEKDDKAPLGEFILSYYDRESGEFPKGETAVLTMVEKDYGEQFIEPAKAFIEQVNQTFEEYQMRTQPQQLDTQEYDRMRELAGLR